MSKNRKREVVATDVVATDVVATDVVATAEVKEEEPKVEGEVKEEEPKVEGEAKEEEPKVEGEAKVTDAASMANNLMAAAAAAGVGVKPKKKVKTVKTGVGAEILYHIAVGELDNKEILAAVLAANPARKTTYACVAWYQSKVKAGMIDLPEVVKADETETDAESAE